MCVKDGEALPRYQLAQISMKMISETECIKKKNKTKAN